MEEFLIGAGVALLLALLAWSDQIKNLHNETLDLEKDFSENRKLRLRKIRTITRAESSVSKRITAINNLLQNSELKEKEDVQIIERLIALDSDRFKLERQYKIKYHLVIILTYLFLIAGIVNYFIDDTSSFQVCTIVILTEFISILVCVVFLIAVLLFITNLNKVESNYIEKLYQIMDMI